jgi:hypothetical protein
VDDSEAETMDKAGDRMEPIREIEPHVLEVLEPGELLRVQARSREAVLAVTDRRLVVAAPERIALAVPLEGLRRIQFDIERDRPATLVIVPEQAHDEPQVLSIPRDEFPAAAEALVVIGQMLAPADTGSRTA